MNGNGSHTVEQKECPGANQTTRRRVGHTVRPLLAGLARFIWWGRGLMGSFLSAPMLSAQAEALQRRHRGEARL